ncbi:MAG: hypothetical protein K6G03_10140 [Lachnospiraceae bacterium]|nr:hypothetical protein [Lachnospiraceae bacterium]
MLETVISESEERERMKRKYQNDMLTIGMGVNIIAFWSSVWMIADIIYADNPVVDKDLFEVIGMNGVLAIASVIMLFVTGIQIYIGQSARKEASGKERRSLYLPLTVLWILFYTYGLFLDFTNGLQRLENEEQDVLSFCSNLILDSVMFIMFIQLFWATIKLRKIVGWRKCK